MKEQLQKIQEHYHNLNNQGMQSNFLLGSTNQSHSPTDFENAVRYWQFCCRLARHLYEVGHSSSRSLKPFFSFYFICFLLSLFENLFFPFCRTFFHFIPSACLLLFSVDNLIFTLLFFIYLQ